MEPKELITLERPGKRLAYRVTMWHGYGVDDRRAARLWCEEMFGSPVTRDSEWWVDHWDYKTFFFKTERDRTLFLLRWS